MTFTVKSIARSLADYLSPSFEGVTFYEDPNQQGSRTPCMFLQQRYAYVESRLSGYFLRRIGLDLTYLADYNLPNMQRLYEQAAETLDILLDTFPYSNEDGNGSTLLRAYDREWRIDPDALHYKFDLKVRVYLPEDFQAIETMEYKQEVRDETVQP